MAKLERTCLYPEDWPENDREALEKSLQRGGLFDTSEAADWSPDTLDRRVRSYGTFLFFAHPCGGLDENASPASRASGRLLVDFINNLEERLAPTSIAIILLGMKAILRVIDPDGDLSEVMAAARYLAWDHPIDETALRVNLKAAQNGQIEMAAADQPKRHRAVKRAGSGQRAHWPPPGVGEHV